jgi:hypothetical protein
MKVKGYMYPQMKKPVGILACTKGNYWNSFIPKYKWPI